MAVGAESSLRDGLVRNHFDLQYTMVYVNRSSEDGLTMAKNLLEMPQVKLLKELRFSFVDEGRGVYGVLDQGGPQRDAFHLAGKGLLEKTNIFMKHEKRGCNYLAPSSPSKPSRDPRKTDDDARYMPYEAAGFLVGSMGRNCAQGRLNLPPFLYSWILKEENASPHTFEDLQKIVPAQAKIFGRFIDGRDPILEDTTFQIQHTVDGVAVVHNLKENDVQKSISWAVKV